MKWRRASGRAILAVAAVAAAAWLAGAPGCTCRCAGGGGGQCAGVNECIEGSTRCTGNLVETCGDLDGDDCVEFGDPSPCPMGQTCSNGQCGDPTACTDECAAGSNVCSGDGVQTCGTSDTDPCLDLGAPMPCTPPETCSNGACAASCVDECAAGTAVCASSISQRLCGDWDSDPCLDLSPPGPCPAGQACIADVGCSAVTCVDECDPQTFSWTCSPTGGYTACVTDGDADPCYEMATEPCTTCPGPPQCVECCG
ncbi:MAG TPA: hypothetical protein VG389_08935 [Myxococcota bacterium]|nr:hypothetical protein [Myxococcota bacterium]